MASDRTTKGRVVALAGVALLVLWMGSPASGQTFERNVNRPGGDYRDFELDGPSPALCQAACFEDVKCKAWTYVRPGVQGEQARCWLKSAVTEALEDRCCVSGMKEAARSVAAAPAARPSTVEQGVDRPGHDYRTFDLENSDPAGCQQACLQDQRCAAWTYAEPGRSGAQAHCWLKGAIAEPLRAEGFVSGVKPGAMESGIDRPGGNYRDLDLAQPDPALCQAACAADGQCRAWTYVGPGTRGPQAQCWLKAEVPPPFESPDCVSGIKIVP